MHKDTHKHTHWWWKIYRQRNTRIPLLLRIIHTRSNNHVLIFSSPKTNVAANPMPHVPTWWVIASEDLSPVQSVCHVVSSVHTQIHTHLSPPFLCYHPTPLNRLWNCAECVLFVIVVVELSPQYIATVEIFESTHIFLTNILSKKL